MTQLKRKFKLIMQRWNKLFYDNKILILAVIVNCVSLTCQAQNPTPSDLRDSFLVVLDPGHGGKDHGCSGHGSIEKEIVLRLSKKLAGKLKENIPNIQVLLTRTEDKFVPLYERAAIANKNDADIFLSIHCNAISHSGTHGTESYVIGLHKEKEHFEVAKRENASILLEQDHQTSYDGFDPNSLEAHIFLTVFQTAYREQSILLAQLIEQEFAQHANRKSRGVKEAGFVVLRATSMPSVLVESGFLTNQSESEFLHSEEGIQLMSDCIFRAISNYIKHMKESEIQIPIDSVEYVSSDTIDEVQTKTVALKNETELYTIQLLALSQEKDLEDLGLNGIQKIEIREENGMYKYMSGRFYSRTDAEKALVAIKELGFSNAYIKRL